MKNSLEGLLVELKILVLYLSKCQNLDVNHESLN